MTMSMKRNGSSTCNAVLKLTAAFLSVLATKRKHISAVTAPAGSEIVVSLETMRNAMVNLILIGLLYDMKRVSRQADKSPPKQWTKPAKLRLTVSALLFEIH